jgi:hypothetical protein
MAPQKPTTAQTAPAPAARIKTYAADRISPKTREILHKAIERGTTQAAGWTGTPLYELIATADPDTAAGKAALIAYGEASNRAYSALASWHRYALAEADGETASIRTPAQLDTKTGSWGGVYYGLNLQTGFCSCPDHAGHLPRINNALMQHFPQAAPVVCKHFIIVAIMAANRELTLPDRATIQTTETPEEAESPALWEVWYHDGDPEKARIFAHSLTHSKAIQEAATAAKHYNAPHRAAKFANRIFEIRPAAPATPTPTSKTHKGDF